MPFPDKVKFKELIIIQPLFYEILKGLIYEKEDKNMNSKVTTNNYQQLALKKKKTQQTTRSGTES